MQHRDESAFFRPNVAALITYNQKILACQRTDYPSSWQCCQGGIEAGEDPCDALKRELEEELSLTQANYKILTVSSFWRRYRFPHFFSTQKREFEYIGQEQLWFHVEILDPTLINLNATHGEFCEVLLMNPPNFLESYPKWKAQTLIDFCKELGFSLSA